MPEVCCSSRSLAASLETCRRVLGHVRSDSAVDQGMDEAVAAAPYLPGPRELLDVGTDQGAPTEADGHRVQIGLLVEVAGFLPAVQAVHGGLQGQLRTGTTFAVESLVAAQQLPVGKRTGGEGQRGSVVVDRPLHEQD